MAIAPVFYKSIQLRLNHMDFVGRKKALFASIMLTCSLGTVLPVSAQELINCLRPDSGIAERRCARLAYEQADRELNAVWKEVISGLTGNEKERLIDRQLAWIEYRDSTCDKETQVNRRGSGYRVFLNNCLRRITIERTEVLRGYLR